MSASSGLAEKTLLRVNDLHIRFPLRNGATLTAVDGVDFTVQAGEIHGIVGESGCGKSVTALSVLGLVDAPGAKVEGEVLWGGRNLLALPERELRAVRGRGIAMVFQNAPASLNPALRIRNQLLARLRLHRGLDGVGADREAQRLLAAVRIPDPQRILGLYAHECSGGMAQRIALALALACNPQLLIADEPTSALDVTVAAQIVELLRSVREEFGLAVLLISHDFGVVARLCDRVSVMYLGKIVESAPARELFKRPLHPYTETLLAAIALPDPDQARSTVLPRGEVPSAVHIPSGCRFHPRCPKMLPYCPEQEPPFIAVDGTAHGTACWLHCKRKSVS